MSQTLAIEALINALYVIMMITWYCDVMTIQGSLFETRGTGAKWRIIAIFVRIWQKRL